jgi:hypothetical protein
MDARQSYKHWRLVGWSVTLRELRRTRRRTTLGREIHRLRVVRVREGERGMTAGVADAEVSEVAGER